MVQNTIKLSLIAVTALILSFSACKKDPLPEVEENELITTLRLKFTNKANISDVKTVTWMDLDGPGGNNPVIDEIVLAPNTSYTLTVDAILNEAENPVEDIKAEVEGEKDDHLFVYKPNPTSLLTITITDKDSKNLSVGLAADAVTTAAGTGKLQVILRHQPDSKNGTETPGSTDLDATFNLKVQ